MPSSDDKMFRLVVPRGVERLDRWLANELPISRSQLARLIKQGKVSVDGEPVYRGRRVLAGAVVEVELPSPPPTQLVAEDIPIDVLFEDDHLIVVNKRAGMVVHPSRGHDRGTLVNALLHRLGPAGQRPGEPGRPGVVHRLDKGTSGVLVVAKTQQALTHLAQQFAEHTSEREYLALVWGRPKQDAGTIDAPVGRHPKDRLRNAVVDGGRRAVTHWSVVGQGTYGIAGNAKGGVVSLLRCRLETGRTHQIRVHLNHLGFPVLGDPLYGLRRRVKRLPAALLPVLGELDHQLLHARMLGFAHPKQERRLKYEAPVPDDYRVVLQTLGIAYSQTG